MPMPATSAYCIFRHGAAWMAFPARAVREVMPRPALVPVPRVSGVLSGICHVRGEVLPVLTFDSLVPAGRSEAQVLIVLDDGDAPWGVLTDEVTAIAPLDPSDAPEDEPGVWASCVVGWARHDQGLIQIVDHSRFRQLAEQELSTSWASPRTTGGDSPARTQPAPPSGAA